MSEGYRGAFYKKKWFWLSVSVLTLIVALLALKERLAGVDVKTEHIKKGLLTITVTATSTGTIKSDNEARIVAQRTGKITKLLFDEGDVVKAGGIVAELDKDEVLHSLEMSEASLNKAEHLLNQMKSSYGSYKVEVERNIDKAQATFSEVESRRKRYLDLRDKGYVTEMDVEAVQREYDVAKATLSSSIASREMLKARENEIKAHEAAVREAKSSLSLSRLNHEYSFVRSPISGVITSRPVKLGEGVIKGALIAAVVSTESMYVEAFIDEADVAKVRTGQKVHITMDAYMGKIFAGGVYSISPVVLGGKQETRTFEVRVRFKESDAVIKPGMSADIEIIIDSIQDVMVIPSQAIIERDGKKLVYAVKGSRAVLTAVETGRSNWSFTEIRSGIKENDEIAVSTDVSGLKHGVRVRRTR